MLALKTSPPEYERKIVRSCGTWWFERYEDWQHLYARLVVDRNDLVQQLVTDGNDYLDIGCGFGDMLFLLRNRFGTLHGIDPAPVMVEKAKKNLSGNAIFNAKVHCRSVEALPFEADTFDTVTMLDVYEHVDPESRADALREVHRVLRPGGELLLATPSRRALRFWNVVDGVLSLPFTIFRRQPIRIWKFVTKSFTEEFCSRNELFGDLSRANFEATHFSRVGFYPAPEKMGLTGGWLRRCWSWPKLYTCTDIAFRICRSISIWRQKMVVRCVKQ